MEDKLLEIFQNGNFDTKEPISGHVDRFERKLLATKNRKKTNWKWMSIAASVLLCIGFYLGNITSNEQSYQGKLSPKMQEAEHFFQASIQQDLKEIEKYRNIDTERIIEDALEKIEELEEQFNLFTVELSNNNNQRYMIQAMISNYQKRLDILNQLLNQLNEIKKSLQLEHYDNEII